MLLAPLLFLVGQDAPPARFLPGDLASLEARVVGAEAIGTEDSASMVEIEVTNRGAIDAEPLVFELDSGTRGLGVGFLDWGPERMELSHHAVESAR